jgi:hypothetical protein
MKCLMCYVDLPPPTKPITTEFEFCSCECYEEFVDWAREVGKE